jgi:cytochrome c2
MNVKLLLPAMAALAALIAQDASADPKRIAFPNDYKEKFTFYSTHNRPDNGQVRYLYANDKAVEGARRNGPLPDGSVLLIEVFKAKVDANNQPVMGADGFYEKGELQFFTAMEKRAGWGAEYPEDIRNGDWDYAVFNPTKLHRDAVDVKPCLTCHKPLGDIDYVVSYDELVAKVRAVPTVTSAEARMSAAGNADRGKALFTRCSNCHIADPSGKHKVGPNLSGVVGRAVAAAPGYAYSADLKNLGQSWDEVRLDAWLAGPQNLAKGTKMVFPGFVKAQDRADVIAYLKTVK